MDPQLVIWAVAALAASVLLGLLLALRRVQLMHRAAVEGDLLNARLAGERDHLEVQVDDLHEQLGRARVEIERNAAAAREQSQAAARHEADAVGHARQLEHLRRQHDQLAEQLLHLTSEHARLKAEHHAHVKGAAEKLALLEQTEARLGEAFDNLANRILDSKADSLRTRSAEHLGALLEPLNQQLNQFRESVVQVQATEQRERGMLAQQVRSLQQLNQKISEDAVNLTRALQGQAQVQGAWGEMILERVLEASGLQAGREYVTQASYRVDGRQLRPDAIIRLPDARDVVVDAKVSLRAYQTASNSDDLAARSGALKEHVASLRRHVDDLAARNYAGVPQLRTLDFVIMFVPIEGAFIEAIRADVGLYDYALQRNVSLASPSTLLATLRTIAHLWSAEQRNENAIEIARRGALLHDSFTLLVEELQLLGEQLDKASRTQRQALRRITEGGRGSIVLQVNHLRELGVPAKRSLPGALLDAKFDDDADAMDDPAGMAEGGSAPAGAVQGEAVEQPGDDGDGQRTKQHHAD